MQKNNNLFSRRLFILFAVKVTLLLVLVFRLVFLQIRENFHFQNLADKNRTNNVPIIPKRGALLDTLGEELATNILLWEVMAIKSQITTKIELFINNIASIVSIDKEQRERIIKDYKNHPAHMPLLIKQNLSKKEIAALQTFAYNIPGTFIRPYYRRFYPFSYATAHLLGYTGLSNDMSKTNNVTNWHIGRSGLETILDPLLKGEVGYSQYEVNAKGSIIRQLNKIDSKPGQNISLTIDSELQDHIYRILSRYNSASAAVIEIPSGNVLALTSYPSFDANSFALGISQAEWNGLINNDRSPLSYKAIQGLYPPGSTIKPIIALAALKKGLITKDTKFECTGHIDIGRDRFHCWKRQGHGEINLERGLVESCDIVFYRLAEQLSIKEMSDAARHFGWGSTHLKNVQHENAGRLLDRDPASSFTYGDRVISGIGQGKWLTTPLQLGYMTTAFANNGVPVKPRLIKSVELENKIIYYANSTTEKKVPYDQEHLDLIKNTFYGTVNVKGGTARLAQTYIKDWQLGGKTGTSQVRRITLKERQQGIISNHLLPWNYRDHGLFVGYVPFNKPKYVISVVVEHGGSAAISAAPISKEIALKLHERDAIYQAENERINQMIKG